MSPKALAVDLAYLHPLEASLERIRDQIRTSWRYLNLLLSALNGGGSVGFLGIITLAGPITLVCSKLAIGIFDDEDAVIRI